MSSFSLEVRVKTIDESVLTCTLTRSSADELAALTILDLKREIAALLVPAIEAPSASRSENTLEESSASSSSSSLSIDIHDNNATSSSSSASSSSSSPALSPETLRLIFRGRLLSNTSTLTSCKIESGSTVHLVARCADAGLASPEHVSSSSPSSANLNPPPISIGAAAAAAAAAGAGAGAVRSTLFSTIATTINGENDGNQFRNIEHHTTAASASVDGGLQPQGSSEQTGTGSVSVGGVGASTGIPAPDPTRGMSAATAAFISTGGAGGQRVPAAAAMYLPSRNLEPLHQNLPHCALYL